MRSISIICLAFVFAFFSCEGPVGPPGPPGQDGLDGLDGVNIEGYTFEYENIDFTSGNEYAVTLNFPETFQMLESDVVLVYLLWGVDGETPIWRALPNTVFSDYGNIQYNFDFTIYDVLLFMDSDFLLTEIPAEEQDAFFNDWIARVVVVPAQFEDSGRVAAIDFTDYYQVIEHFNIDDKPLNISKYSNRP